MLISLGSFFLVSVIVYNYCLFIEPEFTQTKLFSAEMIEYFNLMYECIGYSHIPEEEEHVIKLAVNNSIIIIQYKFS